MKEFIILGFNLYQILFFFLIYAFVGWCLEVSYSAVSSGRFVNCGMLNGPICPIYGFGGVIVLVLLAPFNGNLPLLFALSVILASALEYVTGFLLERIFHTKWWDYSNMPFNLHGYICLKFSLAWGVACVFVIKIIHPLIAAIVNVLPSPIGYIVLLFAYIILSADITATLVGILKMNLFLKELHGISVRIRESSDVIGEKIAKETIELKDEYEKRIASRAFSRNRFIRAFPNMKSRRYNDVLDDVVKRFNELRSGRHTKKKNADRAKFRQ